VSPTARPDHGGNPVAVLVRTYKCDAKYHDLMSKLDTTREGFDLYAIVNETDGRNDPGPWPAIWHSVAGCKQLGLSQEHPSILLLCSDFPLYFALREIPRYQYYIMIEDDVDLHDRDARFLVEMCQVLTNPRRPMIDFAGFLFRPDPHGIWGPATAQLFTPEYCYLARFPFVVVSKKLCAYAFLQRQVEGIRNPPPEGIMHCEVFMPSAAMAGGFACADLNDLIPGCCDQSMMMFEVPGYGLPMGARFRGPDHIRIYHPVYTPEEWVKREKHRLMLRPERFGSVLVTLGLERSAARATGDVVMVSAIEQLAEQLDPRSRDLLNHDWAECRLTAPPEGDADAWHPVEQAAWGPYRWTRTSETTWATSFSCPSPTFVRLIIPIRGENAPDDRASLRLAMNGREFPLRYEGGNLVAVVRMVDPTPGRVTLVAPPPRSPSELRDSSDTRKLGIAVSVV
jgi:hypothetical protein